MDASSVHSNADLSEHERELMLEVRDLKRRVLNLKQRAGTAGPVPSIVQTSIPAALPRLSVFAEVVPIFGRALLGIAGAYLLRALTELGVLPRASGIALGIVYAVLWLWFAARLPAQRSLPCYRKRPDVRSNSRSIAVGSYHPIQCGFLRDNSHRACCFSLIGQALSWRKNLTIISGIATASSTLIAAVLLVATHDLVPFTLALPGDRRRRGVYGLL